MARVEIQGPSGCWLWKGRITGDGYGRFKLPEKDMLAHRLMYELKHGAIPIDKEIDHLCRRRNCVNPAHLEAVTHLENQRRGNSGDYLRKRTHCPRGHPYSGRNLIIRGTQGGKSKPGSRMCRTCVDARNERDAKRRANMKGAT